MRRLQDAADRLRQAIQEMAQQPAGPVDLPRIELANVWRDWDSAIVGPRATVRTYDNENFRDRTAVLYADQSVPDLRDRKLGWFEEVKSARVACGWHLRGACAGISPTKRWRGGAPASPDRNAADGKSGNPPTPGTGGS